MEEKLDKLNDKMDQLKDSLNELSMKNTETATNLHNLTQLMSGHVTEDKRTHEVMQNSIKDNARKIDRFLFIGVGVSGTVTIALSVIYFVLKHI